MKPEQENKPEKGHRIDIEIDVEVAPDDAPKKFKRLISTWAWVLVLVVSFALQFLDGDSPLSLDLKVAGVFTGLAALWFLAARVIITISSEPKTGFFRRYGGL